MTEDRAIRKRAGLDRDQVLAAAERQIDADPTQPLSLTTLALGLGVRTPTLYHYIDGMDEMYRLLRLQATNDLARVLMEAMAGRSGIEGGIVMANAYRAFARQHPGMYGLTVQAASADDDELRVAQENIVRLVARVFLTWQMDDDTLVHTIRALRSMIHGFVTIEIAGGFGLAQDIDESFRRLIHNFFHTLPFPERRNNQ